MKVFNSFSGDGELSEGRYLNSAGTKWKASKDSQRRSWQKEN